MKEYFTNFVLVDEDADKTLKEDDVIAILDKAQALYDEGFKSGDEVKHNGFTANIIHPDSEGKIEGIDYGIVISK